MKNFKNTLLIIALLFSIVLNGTMAIFFLNKNLSFDMEPTPQTPISPSQDTDHQNTLKEYLPDNWCAIVAETTTAAALNPPDYNDLTPHEFIVAKVMEREIIPDDYFSYITDTALLETIQTYNAATRDCRYYFETAVFRTLTELLSIDPSASTYSLQKPEVQILVKKLAKYALYENSLDLIYNDPELSQMLQMKPFKSNQNWLDFVESDLKISKLQNAGYMWNDEYLTITAEEYLALSKKIIIALLQDTTKISEKILNREIVSNDYFFLIQDPALRTKIQKYNELTGKYRMCFTYYAIGLCSNYFLQSENQINEHTNYLNRPDEIIAFVPRISKNALYRNAAQLLYTDWYMSPMLALDQGGSAGVWPAHMHAVSGIPQEELNGYFDLVDQIILSLQQ